MCEDGEARKETSISLSLGISAVNLGKRYCTGWVLWDDRRYSYPFFPLRVEVYSTTTAFYLRTTPYLSVCRGDKINGYAIFHKRPLFVINISTILYIYRDVPVIHFIIRSRALPYCARNTIYI